MHGDIEGILKLCRLCQVMPGTIKIVDNNEFINQVLECTKIKIDGDHMHILPSAVCSSCKLNIEEFFSFVQEIRLVDRRLQDKLFKFKESKSELCYNNSPVDPFNSSVLKKQLKKTCFSKRFKCPVCPKTYASLKNLQFHKKNRAHLYCTCCETLFDDAASQKNHICKLDKILIDKKDEILDDNNKEVDVEINENPIEVGAPKADINIEKEFSDNTEKPHLDNVKTSNNYDQSTVIDIKKIKSKGGFACNICDENFINNADFRAHQKHQHRLTFSCTFENCSKICSSAYSLRTHLMKHEGKMPFLCVTCGKGFTTKNSLNCHEKTHAKIKGYVCKECNIGFSVASNLRAHQKKHHEGVRFYCSQCTRAFITKCSLERHELVHTGVKEFKCETCKAAFYTNKELLKHQRYHQGLRLYKCDHCFKTFFEKHHLTIHIRVHTGERPYVCKVPGCGKSFTESQKLSRHIKARHPAILR